MSVRVGILYLLDFGRFYLIILCNEISERVYAQKY